MQDQKVSNIDDRIEYINKVSSILNRKNIKTDFSKIVADVKNDPNDEIKYKNQINQLVLNEFKTKVLKPPSNNKGILLTIKRVLLFNKLKIC